MFNNLLNLRCIIPVYKEKIKFGFKSKLINPLLMPHTDLFSFGTGIDQMNFYCFCAHLYKDRFGFLIKHIQQSLKTTVSK